jgi:iron uptake system component EfeO
VASGLLVAAAPPIGSVASMTNIRTGGLLISLGTAGLLALAACGGGGGGSSSTNTVPADALVIKAEDIKFDKKDYSAPAGEVTVALESKGAQVHSLVIFDTSNTVIGEELKVNPGQTKVETYDLPAGTYSLICDIPGHKEAGMTATLTTS